jgi:hypothetical protein
LKKIQNRKGERSQMKNALAYLTQAGLALGMLAATAVSAAPVAFTTGIPDGRLGAVSRRASPGKVETETADDFILQQTTVITKATITGLLPSGTPLENIKQVEVELYHVFPLDSASPPSGGVPSRMNSPSDVEISSATRANSSGTLIFSSNVLNASFTVDNTVVNGINRLPNLVTTHGEGPATGEEVEITVTFTTPIIVPAGHYFFRPEVLLSSGDFLYLSANRPIVPPGTPFVGDLQAWIRNANLSPDWLRIGTDIIGGATPPTFNMTYSFTGETVPQAGTPGQPDCHGTTIAALTQQFGNTYTAASSLGFSSVQGLQEGLRLFCDQ